MNTKFRHYLAIISGCIILSAFAVQAYAQQPRPLPAAYPQNTQVSFVRTWNATAPEQDPNVLMTKPLKDVKQSTNYLDGLGRPLQVVVKQGSMQTGSSAADMVSPVEYDEFDREVYKYLPFTANTAGGNTAVNNGAFKLNPFQQQESFMNAQYGAQNETFFYGKNNFEASPVNRVTDTYAPGNSWVGSETNAEAQRRNVQMKSYLNTAIDAVRIWTVSNSSTIGQFSSYATTTIYPAGELHKNIGIDEHKKQVIEFKDKEGKIILKKVQLTAAADNGTGSNYTGWLCTYYIYDDLGNLRSVIQPEGVKALAPGWTLTANQLNEQCFRYEYDQRNRMIMKKVPGAGEVYMIYDTRDRLVMTQDANMRQGTVTWLVTKYDELNRPTETGLWTNNTSFSTHLSSAYSSSSYPSTASGYELLSLTHYDDYNGLPPGLSSTYLSTWNSNFDATNNTFWPYPQMPVQSKAVNGLPAWTQVKVLGTVNTYLSSVTMYDEKGNAIQVQSTNISGGTDVVTTQYNWAGQPLIAVQKQEKAGTNAQATVVVTKITYDDLARLLKVEKKLSNTLINSNAMSVYKTIVQNEYDQLGQLKKKSLGSNNLETLAYDYNIRGWMLGANRDYAKDANTNNYFGFDLGYDKANNNIIGSQMYANPQFNGNIEGMVWKTKGDGEKRKYDFAYDAAGRLLKADFTQYTGGAFNQNSGVNFDVKMGDGVDVNTAYDDNGNIKRMQQWGWKLTGSEQVDHLRYTYIAGTNKLKSVTDFTNNTATKLGDFKTDATHPQATAKSALTINSTQVAFDAITDYVYDVNGNLTQDGNKAISSISYNHLNLPVLITVTGKGSITYSYDAAGNKISKQVTDNSTAGKTITSTTTYITGMVYESRTTSPANTPNDDYTDRLQFIGQEEGRIRFRPAIDNIAAGFEYDYMLKDHLGNVRMVLTEQQQQDRYPAATLEDVTYNGGTAVSIESQFYNIDNTKIAVAAFVTGLPAYQNNNSIANNNPYSNTTANSTKLYKLDATNNMVQDKNGLGIVLKVMVGDVINIFGKSYHKMPGGGYSSATNPLSVLDLMNLLVASPQVSGKGISGAQISGLPGFPANVTSLLNNQPPQSSTMPRASINWVILDEQFKYVSGGFDMVGTASNTNGTFKDHGITGISIPKNGYIYVYCSNESQYSVFFDNVQVVHDRGPVLEETHYYPFGLTMAGISSKAAGTIQNKEKTFQGQRFDDELGLNWIQFKWRNHDVQIGRFIEIDPLTEEYVYNGTYVFSENKVTNHVELEGLEAVSAGTPAGWLAAGLSYLGQAGANLVSFNLEYHKTRTSENTTAVTTPNFTVETKESKIYDLFNIKVSSNIGEWTKSGGKTKAFDFNMGFNTNHRTEKKVSATVPTGGAPFKMAIKNSTNSEGTTQTYSVGTGVSVPFAPFGNANVTLGADVFFQQTSSAKGNKSQAGFKASADISFKDEPVISMKKSGNATITTTSTTTTSYGVSGTIFYDVFTPSQK